MRYLIPILFLVFNFMAFPAVAQAEKYTCPMHPHYVAVEPGMDTETVIVECLRNNASLCHVCALFLTIDRPG